jgi:hypothetical protein
MIARKTCLFSGNHVSRASSQSWMTLIGRTSGANRTCFAEQSLKGTQRG